MDERVERYFNKPAPTNDLRDHPDISGFELDQDLSASELLEKMAGLGFQASRLSQALEVIKAMRRENSTVFLAFTGNMITSGLRELIRYLVQHKFVDVLVTNGGGVEEDVMKSLDTFKLGEFNIPGKMLKEEGIHRTGNILIPTDRYTKFEQFISPLLDKLFSEKNQYSVTELVTRIGKELDSDSSILTWAARNEIPIFCPGVQDGSLGEMFYFKAYKNQDIVIDIAKENKEINDIALNAEKTGAIILGSGISKHFTLLGNILREGLDYTVLITTAQEFDGSDSGARLDEAVTWHKIKPDALSIKVHSDATIAFPLLANAWMAWERSR